MQIAKVFAHAWDVPMRAPYRSAQRTTTVAHNVLVKLVFSDGTVGFGESAPAQYVTGETQASVLRAVNLAAPKIVGKAATDAAEVISEQLVTTPGAVSALEMALYDAMARATDIPLFRLMGAGSKISTSRITDISLPLLTPEETAERAARAARSGFTTIKLKLGAAVAGGIEEDLARIRAVAAAAPGVKLRLDGNQAFSSASAVELVEKLDDLLERIELLEQPTKAGDDDSMAFVQRRVPLPIFADESCHTAEDAARLLQQENCRGIVLKLAKSGLTGAYSVAQTAAEQGGICLFGCMMETRLGIAAALHLTLALGKETVPMLDLDGHLLVDDTLTVIGGPRQDGETLSVDSTLPGLGLTVALPG